VLLGQGSDSRKSHVCTGQHKHRNSFILGWTDIRTHDPQHYTKLYACAEPPPETKIPCYHPCPSTIRVKRMAHFRWEKILSWQRTVPKQVNASSMHVRRVATETRNSHQDEVIIFIGQLQRHPSPNIDVSSLGVVVKKWNVHSSGKLSQRADILNYIWCDEKRKETCSVSLVRTETWMYNSGRSSCNQEWWTQQNNDSRKVNEVDDRSSISVYCSVQ
jgi:hypothetical protein